MNDDKIQHFIKIIEIRKLCMISGIEEEERNSV